jgi:hypothetical protein
MKIYVAKGRDFFVRNWRAIVSVAVSVVMLIVVSILTYLGTLPAWAFVIVFPFVLLMIYGFKPTNVKLGKDGIEASTSAAEETK